MSLDVTRCEWDPEEDLTWLELEVTGPSGCDLSIPWFHPGHPLGCPPHGRLHWQLSHWRTLPWGVKDPQVTGWSPLSDFSSRPGFNSTPCRPIWSWQTGNREQIRREISNETEVLMLVSAEPLPWWSCPSLWMRFGTKISQHTHTHTRTLWDHMSRQRDQHMCTRVQAPPLDPTQQSSMQSSLEFTQIAKNTPAREEIPTFRSNRPPLQRQPNNQPLPTRNRPRQYRKTEASESCFSRIDCCV